MPRRELATVCRRILEDIITKEKGIICNILERCYTLYGLQNSLTLKKQPFHDHDLLDGGYVALSGCCPQVEMWRWSTP